MHIPNTAVAHKPSRYDFLIACGRVVIGFSYRGRLITAPASIILGGIDHGRYVYKKDERKRSKREPKDLTLIKLLNVKIETETQYRTRNLLTALRMRSATANQGSTRDASNLTGDVSSALGKSAKTLAPSRIEHLKPLACVFLQLGRARMSAMQTHASGTRSAQI